MSRRLLTAHQSRPRTGPAGQLAQLLKPGRLSCGRRDNERDADLADPGRGHAHGAQQHDPDAGIAAVGLEQVDELVTLFSGASALATAGRFRVICAMPSRTSRSTISCASTAIADSPWSAPLREALVLTVVPASCRLDVDLLGENSRSLVRTVACFAPLPSLSRTAGRRRR
jgi:hypothetical protein